MLKKYSIKNLKITLFMYGDDNNYNGIQKIARMTIFFQNKNIIIVIIVECTVYILPKFDSCCVEKK